MELIVMLTILDLLDPSDYQTDLTVEQLDRDDTVLKSYIFRNSFPVTIGQIDLSSIEILTEIETFEITWRYQYFEFIGTLVSNLLNTN